MVRNHDPLVTAAAEPTWRRGAKEVGVFPFRILPTGAVDRGAPQARHRVRGAGEPRLRMPSRRTSPIWSRLPSRANGDLAHVCRLHQPGWYELVTAPPRGYAAAQP